MELLDQKNGFSAGQKFASVQEPTVSLDHGHQLCKADDDGHYRNAREVKGDAVPLRAVGRLMTAAAGWSRHDLMRNGVSGPQKSGLLGSGVHASPGTY